MNATLFGVGVGPGAPDLLTLRGLSVLRESPVLAIPRRDAFTPSLAWRIAEPTLGPVEGQERLFFEFPMTRDPSRLRPAWEHACAAIGERLVSGKNVAFLTEGDPLVYSTFIYLMGEAKRRWPELRVEVVPAVSSVTAVASVTGIPLADGGERVAILPAIYGVEDLEDVLRKFDTVVLMKVGSVMGTVVEALERTKLLDKAVYVSRATMVDQRIVWDLASLRNDRCDYFSMVVVSKKTRSGQLVGQPDSHLHGVGGGP